MIGLVLAAGAGRRLHPLTHELPKTLLPVAGEKTILDIALSNLRDVGLTDVVLVTGFAAERIEERVPELERQYGLKLHTVFNDKAEEWNNAYSLWLARKWFAEGVLLVNGDTVHPVSVEKSLLSARGPDILLAVDDAKPLADEEMKVLRSEDGTLQRINKALDPASAAGEYIGVTLIEPPAAESLASALEATWSREPSLYYEDGYQEFVDAGGTIGLASIGRADWVEVDNHDDLARAREVACHY
jgi:choline kinase